MSSAVLAGASPDCDARAALTFEVGFERRVEPGRPEHLAVEHELLISLEAAVWFHDRPSGNSESGAPRLSSRPSTGSIRLCTKARRSAAIVFSVSASGE